MPLFDPKLTELNKNSEGKFEVYTKTNEQLTNRKSKSESILYLDDDANMLSIIKYLLERRNEYRVNTVTDPHEAVEMVSNNVYDCILSDYDMPKMNGISFLKTIRSQGIYTPFILISNTSWREIEKEALNAGVDLFIPKEEMLDILCS